MNKGERQTQEHQKRVLAMRNKQAFPKSNDLISSQSRENADLAQVTLVIPSGKAEVTSIAAYGIINDTAFAKLS